MKWKRYSGRFIAQDSQIWRVDIMQDSQTPFTVGELDFDIDPLTIEWKKTEKHETICGSIAMLKIISPGDRTYEDLYSLEPGNIAMSVYKGDQLYWSGCLDPEFYEEPYEMDRGYAVTFAFSDFGILNRSRYDLQGFRSVADIVRYCLAKAGIGGSLDTAMISSRRDSAVLSPISLETLRLRSDNFYDEDEEGMNLDKVLAGVLQPLALKIIQKAGKVYLYDLNGLYRNANTKQVYWTSDSQTLGTDKVYNNAVITWSQYAMCKNMARESGWPEGIKTPLMYDALGEESVQLGGITDGDSVYYSFHAATDVQKWNDLTDIGFTLWTTQTGTGAELGPSARFFKIVPQIDGQDAEGVAVSYRTWWYTEGWYPDPEKPSVQAFYHLLKYRSFGIPSSTLFNAGGVPAAHRVIFRQNPVWLPPVSDEGSGWQRPILRIKLEMLFDPRFNPFESAAYLKGDSVSAYGSRGPARQDDQYDRVEKKANFIHVPVLVKFIPDGSETVYVWTNEQAMSGAERIKSLKATYGTWVPYSEDPAGNPEHVGYFAWYDLVDRTDKSGVLGWHSNMSAVNPHPDYASITAPNAHIDADLEHSEEGQYICYPPTGQNGGQLSVEVLGTPGTWKAHDGGDRWGQPCAAALNAVADMSWILFKLPEIYMMNNTQFGTEPDDEDIEYSGELLAGVKNDLPISTICGTSEHDLPAARGAFYDMQGKQIHSMYRAGRTGTLEDLLIGTFYSQYAERHAVLSGETSIDVDGPRPFVEDNQPGRKFICVEEIQNIGSSTSESVFIELSPDEYERR